jgi:hypothetical protein
LPLLAAACLVAGVGVARADGPSIPPATPGVACDQGSLPEKLQGAVPPEDVYPATRASKGYTCNAREVGKFGSTGGFRVERYADRSGHVCAYYDSAGLTGTHAQTQAVEGFGVYVMDLSDPRHPRQVTTLLTPAMQTPHESLRLNAKRGLLAAGMGLITAAPGIVDVYDVSKDCRAPELLSSTPLGVLGHESGFAPDGLTFYVTDIMGATAAVDLTDPKLPSLLWFSREFAPHGVSISDDGRTMYMTEQGGFKESLENQIDLPVGLTILDVSDIQDRKPNPQVRVLSRLTWPTMAVPQNATPFTSKGHRYVMEVDEFGGGAKPVGAARIIDVDDLRHPRVVSDLRLAANNDPSLGYQAHYCTLPSRLDPAIVACSFIKSGLRVFDIRDPRHPKEAAYFNMPRNDAQTQGASAYSAPAFDPVRGDVWYTDDNSGFHVVHLTRASGITRFAKAYFQPGS